MIKKLKKNLRKIQILLTEMPLQEIKKNIPVVTPRGGRLIPNVVYQTWINNLFGKTHADGIKKFRSLNPELEFNLYDAHDLDVYMQNSYGSHQIYQVYKNTKFGPMKADIFRYCILYEKGGYYFDIKGAIKQPIVELCPDNVDGMVAFEGCDCSLPPDDDCLKKIQHPTKYVVQWGMGFTSGHPILRRMIEDICKNYPYYQNKIFDNPKLAILSYTATGKFTQVVREEIGRNHSIKVFQAGIDFNGQGIYAMNGSGIRYLTAPPYTNYSNTIIVS
jgi:mannosyltransferase OCH1-like enzyme